MSIPEKRHTDNAEDAVADFLLTLYGTEGTDGHLVICGIKDEKILRKSFQISQEEEAARWAACLAEERMDTYFELGLQEAPPSGRGSQDTVCKLPALVLDADMKVPGHHSKDNLPASRGEVMEALQEVFPPELMPSLVISTGGGLHLYWLFKELWVFEHDAEHNEAKQLSRDLQATVRAKWRERGWHLDSTASLEHLFRLPGTYNYKDEDSVKEVKVVNVNSNATGGMRRYDPHELEPYLTEEDDVNGDGTNGTKGKEVDFPPADAEAILEQCAFLRHCKEDAATLPEPEWFAMVELLARCANGRELAHEWSRPYPDYTQEETEKKFQRAVKKTDTVGPHTCRYIRQELGFDGCRECDHTVKSPAVLGLDGGLISINTSRKNLTWQTDKAWQAIQAKNEKEPTLYSRSGRLTRIKVDEKGYHILELVSEAALRDILDRVARWYKVKKSGDEYKELDAYPPTAVVKNMMVANPLPTKPLQRLVHAPVFSPDGEIMTRPGYHEKAQTWHIKTCDIPEVSNNPSEHEIKRAKDLIFKHLLVDFPFVDETGRAYIVAALLLPFVRQMIDSCTPLHIVDAISGEGTGKTLLVDCITTVATGREPQVLSEGRDEDEWRKRITAKLIEGPAVVVIDNVQKELDSSSLSAALTTRIWEDRILGKSEMITCPVDCLWIATGNSIQTSREIRRRIIKTQLDAKMDQPWRREPKQFRHKNLLQWVKQNRGDLVWACLTIVQKWISEGQPQGGDIIGKFEEWSQTMGGILKVAEIPGFLENLDNMYEGVDRETEEWREFVEVWWDLYGGTEKVASEIQQMALKKGLLLKVMGDGNKRSQLIKLGKALKKAEGRFYSTEAFTYEIKLAGKQARSGTKKYKLDREINNLPF